MSAADSKDGAASSALGTLETKKSVSGLAAALQEQGKLPTSSSSLSERPGQQMSCLSLVFLFKRLLPFSLL